ncbi:hypothetical protein DESUT3_03520 [Desulfuromonas versatilis]|uniref:F5/8 type C domain-containing protein n=2 Tax=Desulfuromonas versatilis TaxID=2802975 RepID=A0ABM8HRT5_9BACT|nr:hypothetical protein DESUT3_03520 [Desulfuromonas versatilis]
MAGAGVAVAAEVGGFIGIPEAYNQMVEFDCRVCHEDPNVTLADYLPDRHHGLEDRQIPPGTDAPGSSPGEVYSCFSCHQLQFDPGTGVYLISQFRDCLACHTLKPGQGNTVHHRGASAQGGTCTHCHKVPAFAQDRPMQAACRECHGLSMHDNGGPVQDYGACVSCHMNQAQTAGDPPPFHAAPGQAVGYLVIPSGRASPGGPVYPAGKGIFAVFWSQYTRNGNEDFMEDNYEDIKPNGEDLNDEGGFRWKNPTLMFNLKAINNGGKIYNVPSFDGVQASGIPGAPVITIEKPIENATVAGTVEIQARVTDNRQVRRVYFWVDQGSKILMSGPNSSASGTWTTQWDSRYIPYGSQNMTTLDGSHTINIQAEDDQGTISTKAIAVTVNNSGGAGGGMTMGNLALGKLATASRQESGYEAAKAVDSNTSSRWWTRDKDTQWLRVNLNGSYSVSKVVINWHNYYAREYRVQVSSDGRDWTTVREMRDRRGGREEVTFPARSAQYLRIECRSSASDNGYSIYELEAYR